MTQTFDNNQYKQFSDPKFIKDTVRDLMELPTDSFKGQCRTPSNNRADIDYIIDKITEVFNISAANCHKMTFGEFITVVEALRSQPQKNCFESNVITDDEMGFYTALVRKLLSTNRSLPEIKLFNAINADTYLKILNSICCADPTFQSLKDSDTIDWIRTMVHQEMPNRSDITLGEVFDFLDREGWEPWYPWTLPVEEYGLNISDAYDKRWWLIKMASDIILSRPYDKAEIIKKYGGDYVQKK